MNAVAAAKGRQAFKFRTNNLLFAIAILLGCMAMPSVARLAHGIFEHQELECSKDSRLHFHSAEFDCEFQKFKNTSPLYFDLLYIELPLRFEGRALVTSCYSYLQSFPKPSFRLRGPPSIS